ncbi:MAG: hypothetical protein ACI9MC_000035 [Kiritimatiellia bacterium]|jgi:hypothetical protein
MSSMAFLRWGSPAALALIAFSLGACNESQITLRRVDSVAVTVGDFDNVQAPFNRQVLPTTSYDGIISAATWDETYESAPGGLNVEGLFLGDKNREIISHGTVFVASGTRGFGLRQYNSLQPDDQIVSDANAISNTQFYVRGGGVLLLTDWAYDMIPAAFPDKIDFVGDETFDVAQRGKIGRISARVTDEELEAELQTDVLSLTYDFSNWAVMEDVLDDNVRVYLRGDVQYLAPDGEGYITVEDAPLLVSFQPDNTGQVVYSSFHLDAQNPAVIDSILRVVVGEFDLKETNTLPTDGQNNSGDDQ